MTEQHPPPSGWQQPYGQQQAGWQPPQPPPYGYPPPPGYYPGYPPPVAKPTGWFIVNWLFFWPSAIYSLVTHWNNIDRAAYAGDLPAAQRHAESVKRLGIWALAIAIGIWVVTIILMVTVFATAGYSTCAGFNASC